MQFLVCLTDIFCCCKLKTCSLTWVLAFHLFESCLPTLSGSVVQVIEILGLRAVNAGGPVADKVLLLEQSSFWARERLLGEAVVPVVGADMENLASCLWIPIRVVNLFF